MKKKLRTIYVLLAGIIVFTIIQGCTFFDMPIGNYSLNGNKVELTYHTKDVTDGFMTFLQNPISVSPVRSVLEPGDSIEVSDADMFAALWATLREEQRAQILSNPQVVKVEIEESISVSADSGLGRSIIAGNIGIISELTERFNFFAQLRNWFSDKEVPYTYVGIESGIAETVLANLAIQRLLLENDMEGVAAILHYLDMNSIFDDLQTRWEAFAAIANAGTAGQRSVARNSSGGATYSSALFPNLGATLQDGDVLVMSRNGSADFYAGIYDHAGIFSRSLYNAGGMNDRVHCVYTAQPSATKNIEEHAPDRPGYACLDTISLYTFQKKIAVIRPKNYTTTRAATAVRYAKDEFYDKKRRYSLPLLEFLKIGDTSHNSTSDTYCSKVPWHAWNRAGVDLDARNGHGNFIVPDKLYDSSIDRYTIGVVKVNSTTNTKAAIQTYVATSNVVIDVSR